MCVCVRIYFCLAPDFSNMQAKNSAVTLCRGNNSHALWGWCHFGQSDSDKIPMWKFMNITTMESHLDRIVQWLLWRWEWKVSG